MHFKFKTLIYVLYFKGALPPERLELWRKPLAEEKQIFAIKCEI